MLQINFDNLANVEALFAFFTVFGFYLMNKNLFIYDKWKKIHFLAHIFFSQIFHCVLQTFWTKYPKAMPKLKGQLVKKNMVPAVFVILSDISLTILSCVVANLSIINLTCNNICSSLLPFWLWKKTKKLQFPFASCCPKIIFRTVIFTLYRYQTILAPFLSFDWQLQQLPDMFSDNENYVSQIEKTFGS